jgi:hypothetical protein
MKFTNDVSGAPRQQTPTFNDSTQMRTHREKLLKGGVIVDF